MKVRIIACVSLVFFVVMMTGCTTKGINYEAAMKKFEAGQYDLAIKDFESIAKEKGKYSNRARFYIGESYKFQLKWDQAAEQFQQVVDAELATYLGTEARNRVAQIREGKRDLERLKIIHDNYPGTEQSADALLELGSVYNNKLSDYNRAIATYQQLIQESQKTFPAKAAQAQIEIGYVYLYKLYDYDKAFEELKKVNLQNYPELKFRVSEVEDLRLNVNKTLLEIKDQLVFIKENQKRKIPKGRTYTSYDIYGVKEDQVANAFVALALRWRALKNYPKALEAYETLVERLPMLQAQAGEARYGIGEIYMEQRRYFDAVDAFEECIKRNPTHFRRAEAVYNLAICYESIRDYEKAYEYYKTYRDTYPEKDLFKPAELKVRQYEYDEDRDGFPYYKELQKGTSDTDPSQHP